MSLALSPLTKPLAGPAPAKSLVNLARSVGVSCGKADPVVFAARGWAVGWAATGGLGPWSNAGSGPAALSAMYSRDTDSRFASNVSSTFVAPPFWSQPINLAALYHPSLVRKPLLSGSAIAHISPRVVVERFEDVRKGYASWPGRMPVCRSQRGHGLCGLTLSLSTKANSWS